MGRPVRAEISMADREMRRFIRQQQAEARKLGYPTMATFARDIARGTVGTPPTQKDDPIVEAVGEFFWMVREIDRRILAEKYMDVGTLYERARMAGTSIGSLKRHIDRLLERLSGFLSGKGF